VIIPPKNSGRRLFPPIIVFLSGLLCIIHAADAPSSACLTVSGLNELRFADGDDISHDLPRPWNYLVNSTDIRAGIHGLYLKTRFDIEEPSLGYNPHEPVYREYLSRRTIGFETAPLLIEAGHISAQFGRGLTLSLKEDREVELYTLLDGVYGQLRYSWLTVQAVAGRPLDRTNRPVDLLNVGSGGGSDTIFVLTGADQRFRDLVAGGYAETFLPVDKAPFSFLSSGSIGGGVVRYSTEVGPLSPAFHDTVALERPFWYQNRTSLYFPSASLNLARGGLGVSVENAWMAGEIHRYVNSGDSVRGAFDSTLTTPVGSSTYLTANALVAGISVLTEYKNYFYDRTSAYSNEISAFFVPPAVRYQHSWHLLNKHMLSNLMADALGYNILITGSPRRATLLTADFSYGGRHNGKERLAINPESDYWEAYGEWAEEAGDRFNVKVGFDYGKLDPEQQKVTFRTLACDIEAGPFGKGHSFGLVLESQLNDKTFFIKGSPEAPYRQYAFNVLGTPSYHFSPCFSVAVTLEREVTLDGQDVFDAATDIETKVRNYALLGVNIKPSANHTITLEYGSMSGGKKCTLGTCVDLPPFKGLKVMITSML
jgi:hypothetical protein